MFGFKEIREIKEIKPDETRKQVCDQKEGYKKIKPETDITFEEARNFWFYEIFGQRRV